MQPDPVHRLALQLAFVNHAGWLPGAVCVSPGEFVLEGWAVALWTSPANLRVQLNVRDFDSQLDAVLAGDGFYKDVRHSTDYALSAFGDFFETLDYVPGLAALQDAVVLRRR